MLQLVFQARVSHISLALQFVATPLSFGSLQLAVSTAATILFHLDEQISRTATWKLLPQVFRTELARRTLRLVFPRGKHKIGTGQNQAKKNIINRDEKKIQHNPFPNPIVSESLRRQAEYTPGALLAL